MKKRKPLIRHKKLRGEWAELCFMVAAAEHALPVCKPWGEIRSYDFVVGWPGHFVAVHVKSTICELGAGYACTVRGGRNRNEMGMLASAEPESACDASSMAASLSCAVQALGENCLYGV